MKNELRIGNWVNLNVISQCGVSYLPMKWSEKNFSSPVADEYGNPYNSPIPLTPEILEKCGFDGDEMLIKHSGNQVYLSFSIKDKTVSLWVEGHYKFGKCKYLHELQNLFFANFGEELNIEL